MSRTEDVLGALQLLAAMYPLEGELQLSEGAKTALVAAESGEDFEPTGPIDVVVSVPIDDDSSRRIELAITLPLDADVQISIRQPRFLPRAEYAQLEQDLPQSEEAASDTIMSAIEYVRITAPGLADAVEERRAVPDPGAEEVDDGPLSRVWLWLPGLETREKTRDLVVYAPGFKLTGFVLAGKPGLICLEGGGKAIDRYMAVIKSESWGDVPSFQKKVTERLRRPLAPEERKFKVMSDITSLVPHYGRYNHRGDMGEVKRLMEEWGVGDDFGAAVMNAS